MVIILASITFGVKLDDWIGQKEEDLKLKMPKTMIKYHHQPLLTLAEVKNKTVLLIHAYTRCMFHCFKCINYDTIVNYEGDNYLSMNEIAKSIELHNNLIDMVIISGGEYLMAKIQDLLNDLKLIKSITEKPVIIYTTGMYLSKMKILNEFQLIDGFHIDMKLPYHLLTEDDSELIFHTIGKNISIKEIHQMQEAIEYVIQIDKGYSLIRSVKYPFLDESAFEECSLLVEKFNKRYKKNVPYFTNRFIDLEI